MNHAVYACDVGSVKSKTFAWSRVASLREPPIASPDIDELLVRLERDARSGASVALGFEAPLFMPVPSLSEDLSSGRSGEESRSMFAPAGLAVTTLGLHEAAWILRQLYQKIGSFVEYTVDWQQDWRSSNPPTKLLVWEAFVSEAAHSDTHERDAATAARYFLENENQLAEKNAVTCQQPLSLVHCAAMFAGWSNDVAGLHGKCLVLRPKHPYEGRVVRTRNTNSR
jgi:hypothetical protein